MAALRKVPESSWALVAKVDAEEVYRELRQRSRVTALVVGLLLAGCLLTVGLLRHLQQSRFYRRQYRAELERRRLTERYALVSRCVNDIVLLVDQDGRIVEANDRAVDAYGYPLEDLLRLSIRDLEDPATAGDPAVASGLCETVHRRKDGAPMLVEVSTRTFESGGRLFRQNVVRDIAQRKRAATGR